MDITNYIIELSTTTIFILLIEEWESMTDPIRGQSYTEVTTRQRLMVVSPRKHPTTHLQKRPLTAAIIHNNST